MKVNVTDIKIGKGLGDIQFGCTKDKLKHLLGEPEEIDTYNASGDEDEFLTETWHYDEYEFSVSFDEEDNWKLTTFSISSPACKLNGHQLIGMEIDDVIQLLEEANLGDNELEDLSDDTIEQKLLCYLAASLNLWFEDDKLSEIQWGVLWSDEDTPIFPE
ncbi:MAG: hypothetical protein CO118_05440 [Flavobacteriales bacterium CG_4_9_14_3_um_filter_32_8]|nr:MAG: hypothetical protein CO118_05440 [Flavobacteriales bacterium CG_4_9_14_3_um_filter_32_8]